MKFRSANIRNGWLLGQLTQWREDLELIVRQAYTLSLAARHPRVPLRAKLAAGIGVAYIFSPIQLIPTFIPIVGQLDDLFVLFMAMKAVRRVAPPEVIAECEMKTERKLFAERQRKTRGKNICQTVDQHYPTAAEHPAAMVP